MSFCIRYFLKRLLCTAEKPECISSKSEDTVFERCVICGELTSVRKDTHVDLRDNYETGLGQMCYKCSKAVAEEKYGEQR